MDVICVLWEIYNNSVMLSEMYSESITEKEMKRDKLYEDMDYAFYCHKCLQKCVTF